MVDSHNSGNGDIGIDDEERRETERWLSEARRCGTMELHRLRLTVDREYAERRRATEVAAARYERTAGRGGGGRGAIIRIPVVVHVIYNTSTENISDTQIQNQISVLNTDFRLLNSITDLPTDFSAVAADSRIEFGLAVRDPQCNPTNGITRTFTNETGWPDFSDAMKSAATGGHDPWPTDRYLNIWTIANGGSFIGWAEFPGGAANVDGVVIRHGVFGTGGTVPAGSAFDGGRTATHEIGHWLNLIHIWGDENGCVNSDNVADTPNQADANTGCPTHPTPSCGNSGDMFQNYMDYSDDDCYRLFTAGQVDRMRAALNTARTGILSSAGLVPPPPGGAVADLWIKDTADDVGTEPNPTSDVMYITPDIWVRTQDDGLVDQTHQNAEYRPAGSGSNFVYVRVRNSSCAASASGTLRLYWAKASSGLSWPAPWDGSVTSPALMGGSIGAQPVSVGGGGASIITFPWSPPNPADYASFGADATHFCLLARIETSATAPFGMTSPETNDLWTNVKNNNNIAWKNISVVDEQPGGGRMESMLVAAVEKSERTRLVFVSRDPKGRTVFDWGRILVRLDNGLRDAWERGGGESSGIKTAWDDHFLVTESGASFDGLALERELPYLLDVQFVPRSRRVQRSGLLSLDVEQHEGERVIGGVRFEFLVTAPALIESLTCGEFEWDGVGWPQDVVLAALRR
jgi:hypothetical protein